MKKILLLIGLLLAGAAPRAAAQLLASVSGSRESYGPAPSRPASLAGTWTGPLTLPGKQLPIGLTITENGGRLAASLETAVVRLNHHTMTLTQRHDTLTFYDPLTEARYVCQRSSDGQELVGQWQQLGFRQPLVLRYEAVRPAAKPETVPARSSRSTRTTKWESGALENNRPVGVWNYYGLTASGERQLTQSYDYGTGKLLVGSSDGEAHEAELSPGHWGFAPLTQSPWFIGGREALAACAAKVRYPAEALKANVEGKVTVSVVVDTLGHLSSYRVVRGLGHGCDEEALRVAHAIPDTWTPGRIGTKAVPVLYYLTFGFRMP